jgi:hypothetical protein
MYRYLGIATLAFLTLWQVSCCRTPHGRTQSTKAIPALVVQNSNYVSHPTTLAKSDFVPLAAFDCADAITIGIAKELLDRSEIQYERFAELGCYILVRPIDFKKAKAIIQGDMRLEGRYMVLSVREYD